MNDLIKKALECLEDADRAGYFQNMDNAGASGETYSALKQQFISSIYPFDFSQKLITFANEFSRTKAVFMKNEKIKKCLSDATNEEIPAILLAIQTKYDSIPSHRRSAFNMLKGEFADPSNNFRLSSWKSQLQVWISNDDLPNFDNAFEIKTPVYSSQQSQQSSVTEAIEHHATNFLLQYNRIVDSSKKFGEKVVKTNKLATSDTRISDAKRNLSEANDLLLAIHALAGDEDKNFNAMVIKVAKQIAQTKDTNLDTPIPSQKTTNVGLVENDLIGISTEIQSLVEILELLADDVVMISTSPDVDAFAWFREFYKAKTLENAQNLIEHAPILREAIAGEANKKIFDEFISELSAFSNPFQEVIWGGKKFTMNLAKKNDLLNRIDAVYRLIN